MIRHILLFSLAPHLDQAARESLLEELRRLPSLFPVIRGFELGRNRSGRDFTFDYGMTMTFADGAAMDSYLTSDIHETFVARHFKPSIRHRSIVSFDVEI